MALGVGTVWQVDGTNGNDTNNGGGFDTEATFATDLAATLGTTTAPVVTSASYNFVSTDKWLYVKIGTNWNPGLYPITSASAGAATINATAGSWFRYLGRGANGAQFGQSYVNGVATVASPTAGTWGVDYSQAGSGGFSFSDAVIDATTNTQFTSAAHPLGQNHVGNLVSWTAGTGWTVQRVVINSVSGTKATCDKSLGTLGSTGGTGGLGLPLASPGKCAGLMVNPNSMFIVGGNTYSCSSSGNVANGFINLNGTASTTIVGYTTNRYAFNTDATRPIVQSSSNTMTIVSLNGSSNVSGIDFENGNSNTAVTAVSDNGNGNITLFNCKFNAVSVAFSLSGTSVVDYCLVNACTSGSTAVVGSTTMQTRNSMFLGNTVCHLVTQFLGRSVFYNNGAASTSVVNGARVISSCLFHTNTGANSNIVTGSEVIENSIFWNNTGTNAVAVVLSASDATNEMVNCAFGSNTSNYSNTGNTAARSVLEIALTADPVKNASGGDFSLNSTAGGGALLRSMSFPVTAANGLTTQGLDVGPEQATAQSGGLAGGAMIVRGQTFRVY